MDADDLKVTAYHEAGHALVSSLIPGQDPVHKVTIVSRGMALGATMSLPERDDYHQRRTKLLGLIEACKDSCLSPVVAVPQQGAFVRELDRRQVPTIELPQPKTMQRYGGEVYRYGLTKKLDLAGQALGYILRLRRFLKDASFRAIFCNDMRGLLTVGVAARAVGLPVMIWDKLDKPHGLLDALQLPIASRNLIISQAVTMSGQPASAMAANRTAPMA